MERTEAAEEDEKGKGTLGNSLAINSDEEEVAAMTKTTGGHTARFRPSEGQRGGFGSLGGDVRPVQQLAGD